MEIKLKIKDVEIEMDEKDGQELFDFLQKFFGEKHFHSPIVIRESNPWSYPLATYSTGSTIDEPMFINYSEFRSSSGQITAKIE